MRLKKIIQAIMLSCHVISLSGFDLPVQYRAPFLSTIPPRPRADQSTTIGARFSYGTTCTSRPSGGPKGALLSLCGPIDVKRLGLGVLQSSDRPETTKFWDDGLNQTFSSQPITSYATNDGLFDLHARLRTWEVSVLAEQMITSGLFAYAYLPIRHLAITNISPNKRTHCLGESTCCPAGYVFDFENFVQNNLDTVLQEQGIAPLKTSYCKTGVSELLLGGGWQVSGASTTDSFIELTGGRLTAGVLIPLGGKRDENIIASLPLGYNDHWGFHGRINAQASLSSYIGFGASLGGSVFLKSTRKIRMHSDPAFHQQGIIALGKGRALVDWGSIWDGSGYIELKNNTQSLSFIIGYSYARQEKSKLCVRDECFLTNVLHNRIQNRVTDAKTGRPLAVDLTSKNTIVNADERFLAPWIRETLHVKIQINCSKLYNRSFMPSIALSYDHPCSGARVCQTGMLAGAGSMSWSWEF